MINVSYFGNENTARAFASTKQDADVYGPDTTLSVFKHDDAGVGTPVYADALAELWTVVWKS